MSQSILPGNFSVKGLSVIEIRRLEYYYEQYVLRHSWIYGEGHFILACYAALPVVLTPDLLYKLWLNFKDYWWEDKQTVIHPVAPADLLLSPLVEEIGHELYEMPESIRQVLLLYLKEITGEYAPNPQKLHTLTEIAQFLHSYAQYDFTPANKNDDAFREAQIWTALSYLDPSQAFGQLVNKYKQAKDKSPDQLRYANAIGNMSRRFMLDIVHDPAQVPQAHKAVTALTSVVKDVLNDRDPARLAELHREIQASDDVQLADEPVIKENVISIEVDELVTARLEGVLKKKGKGKLRALVVGVPEVIEEIHRPVNPDKASAELFAAMLQDQTVNESDYELKLLVGSSATKESILDAWGTMVEIANEEDDLLFYLAGTAVDTGGHCEIKCVNITDPKYPYSFLIDLEIGRIANSKQVASITMIIHADSAATGHWLDISRDGNVVFAACLYKQDLIFNGIRTEKGDLVNLFTFALEKALRQKRMQVSNRGLFVLAMEYYHDALVSKNNEDRVWDKNMPVLLCNSNSYDLFFTQGGNNQVALQNALRENGFYTGDVTGLWGAQTARGIVASGLPAGLSKRRYIELLNGQKEARFKEQPVFLFIFSDPGEKLHELERERQGIIAALTDKSLTKRVHIHELHNPDSGELMDYFINTANRNRIQLVYYSGFDERGNFLLRDGVFAIGGFIGLLEYQQNIKLFVSNTCRSEYFAEFVAMLGVPLSIGVRGEISDQEGVDFGIELFKTIVGGGQLGEVRDLGRPYISGENGFLLFKKYADSVLPWKFKEEVKKIRVFLSFSIKDRDLVQALQYGISTVLHNVDVCSIDKRISIEDDWRLKIDDDLSRADIVLVCISRSYFASEYCIEELDNINRVSKRVIGVHMYAGDYELINKLQASYFNSIYHPGEWFDAIGSKLALSDFVSRNNNVINEQFERFLKGLGDAIERILSGKGETTEFIAQNEFPSFEGNIIGREELLQQIDQQLSPEMPLLLRGTVGMGKTTAAIAYCKNSQFIEKYNHVIWINSGEDILYGIVEVLGSFLNELLHDRHTILTRLDSLPGKNLLIIDNVNDPLRLSDFIEEFVAHKMKTNCLIISRCNLYEDNNMGIVVEPLSMADAGELYRRFSHKIFQEEYFKAIYEHVNANVLLIEALAKFANNLSDTSQLYHFLIIPAPTYEQRPFEKSGLMNNVYRSLNLDKDLNDLSRVLSLFPAREFSRQLFLTLFGEQQAVKIEALMLAGWLEKNEENYKIPFIVKVIFRTELMPDVANCSHLITRLMDLLDDVHGENISDLLTIGVSMVREIGLSGSKKGRFEVGKLNLKLGRQLMNKERLAEGLDVVKRAIEIFARKNEFYKDNIDALQLAGEITYLQGELAFSANFYRDCTKVLTGQLKIVSGSEKDEVQLKLIMVYHKIGSLRQKVREYDAALKAYSDALQLKKVLDRRGLMEDWIVKLGIQCHEGIGEVYEETERYELALVSFDEGLSLLKKWGNFEGADEIKNSLDGKIKRAEDSIIKHNNLEENFLSEAELFSVVERSDKLTAPDKPVKSLLLFQTEEKQTWLVATTQYVFIIIDDEKTRKSGKHIQRQIEKNEVLSIETKPQPGLDETSRIVRFAARGREWSYSLSLFPTDEILLRALNELVSGQKKEKNAVSGLQLKMPPATYLPWDGNTDIKVNSEKQQAFLVDRTLVCFAANVTGQQRSDMLNLLLLAQLAARKQYPEIEQAIDWHQSFKNVLMDIGCSIEARGFSQFALSGRTFRLEYPVVNIMANASFKYSLTGFLEKSLATIKSLQTSYAFKKNTYSSYNGAFQICLVTNSNETLELNIGMIMLTSGSPIIELFGTLSTENTKLNYTTLTFNINEQFCASVRDVISEKLIYISVRYVMEI